MPEIVVVDSRMNRRLVVSLCCALAAWLMSAAVAQGATVTSFDGTQIHVNFFPAAGVAAGQKAPTVMLGPGWGSAGDTNATDATDVTTGIPGVGTLRTAGFNVLTWDPRGFGSSGGTVEVDSPQYEGRDVSAMISWIAQQPQALLDAPNNPRVGMAGGSYGGGIQLVSAAIDPRIDAIVPDIAWHSLVTSLYKENTIKLGWSGVLYALGQPSGHLDPLIGESFQTGVAGQPLTSAEFNFFATRGPGNLVSKIHVPTLLIQGTVDNLFTLQEAVTNYAILRNDGVPVKMLWFCGGHGICLTNPGDTSLIDKDTIAWLDRYLKREPSVDTGPTFEWVDQDGAEHTGTDYPLAATTPLAGDGAGTLPLTEAGGSGPVTPAPGSGELGTIVAPITPAKATNAVNVTVPAPSRTALVVGAPQLTFTYRGLGTGENGSSTSIYAQVVDDATGKVLGNQVTPVPISLDGAAHTVTQPLEVLAATDRPGETFTLQLTASTVAYQAQRATGSVTFSKIQIVLPTVDPSLSPPGYGVVGPAGIRLSRAQLNCQTPTGQLSGRSLGPLKLDETRAKARSEFAHFSTRGHKSMDFFCEGIRAGYPSGALMRTLTRRERNRVAGRVILALTANAHYSLHRVHPGARFAAVARRLHTGRGFRVGLNTWYLAHGAVSNAVLKVRNGTIEEIGIADERLTVNRAAAARFFATFD
jgi:ABC-2 type transport system ATP-binding protein